MAYVVDSPSTFAYDFDLLNFLSESGFSYLRVLFIYVLFLFCFACCRMSSALPLFSCFRYNTSTFACNFVSYCHDLVLIQRSSFDLSMMGITCLNNCSNRFTLLAKKVNVMGIEGAAKKLLH